MSRRFHRVCVLTPSFVLPPSVSHAIVEQTLPVARIANKPGYTGDVIYTVVVATTDEERTREREKKIERERLCSLARRKLHARTHLRLSPSTTVVYANATYADVYVCTRMYSALCAEWREKNAALFVFRFTRAAGYDHRHDVIIRVLALSSCAYSGGAL